MDRAAKKYWTATPPGSRLNVDAKGDPSDEDGKTLKIDVTGADVGLSEILRGRVVRRVLLALSRFGPRVRRVTVRLAEPVNPLGGVDQRCRMRAWLRESDGIQAEAINGRMEAAVARAAAQLAKRVDFALDGGASGGADRRRPPLRPRRETRG